MFPQALVDSPLRGAYLCEKWELRITERCVAEDLNRDPKSTFDDLKNIEIVKEFVNGRSRRTNDRSQIHQLTSGREIWVLSRGHDHRGATLFDPVERVVWLLASGRHRSGSKTDFFPYCRELDRKDRLLPTESDYRRMFDEREKRLVDALPAEAALALKVARERPGEHKFMLGGLVGIELALEVVSDLRELTVVFRVNTVNWSSVPMILNSFLSQGHDGGEWEGTDRLPSRPLNSDEVGFTYVYTVDK